MIFRKTVLQALFTIGLITLSEPTSAKVIHILPKPQSVTLTEGVQFALGRPVNIDDPTCCELLTDFFSKYNCRTSDSGATVTVRLVGSIEGAYDYILAGYPNEAYTLSITADSINISAITPTGVIRAAQTLEQMAEGYETGCEALEGVTMTDYPAFKLRGYMHDVGRSFINIDELIHELELLSRFKVNTFHWHLTENQAWRFEIKSYPVLTQSDKMTRLAGKYYTQDDCRRLMAVAKKHGVTVIPEIDMPGHSEAFERAMGYAMQTAQGKEVLKKVLEEVVDVFADAPYIHIGADEKTITDSTFLPTMTSKIHSLGRKAVCWNPISGVTINPSLGFDMTQMWSTGGKLVSGMPSIDCRYNYSNHFDVFADIVGIYKSNIYYAEKGNAEIAGAITASWNDRKTPTQTDILKQNNFYATVLATVERAWMGGGKQYIEQGGTTLPNSGEEYDEFADWERRFLFHKSHSLKNEPIPYVKQTNVRWKITDPFPNNGNINAVFPPEQQEPADQYTYNNSTYGTAAATGAGIYLRHTWGTVIPTFYASDPGFDNTAYAYTFVYSPETRTAGALIEFQNYGRSEKDAAPAAGTWDYKGSKVWLNNQEILPPTWDNTGVTITNEVDLRNENFTARAPQQVELRQGWNKVLIKLPYIQLNKDIVRLNKWLFTFVLTDPSGKEALDDIVYSPSKRLLHISAPQKQ